MNTFPAVSPLSTKCGCGSTSGYYHSQLEGREGPQIVCGSCGTAYATRETKTDEEVSIKEDSSQSRCFLCGLEAEHFKRVDILDVEVSLCDQCFHDRSGLSQKV